MVAIGFENSWFKDLDQGVQELQLDDDQNDKFPLGGKVNYKDLYKCDDVEDELEEMNKMVKLEISKQEYSPKVDDSMEFINSSLSPLLTNSNYNLVESNWHFANQTYHQVYKQHQQQQQQQQQKQQQDLIKKERKLINQQRFIQLHKQRSKFPKQNIKQLNTYQQPVPLPQNKDNNSDENQPLVLSSSIISIPVGSRFFVIKSFNQQDINSSFIHKIWSSTDIGNNRLAKAFNNKYSNERIFLLFSVNGSGKFCGVAEMKSSLRLNPDGHENENVWLDGTRWKGNFKIQWLIIKDISNLYLKHLKFQSTNNFTNTFELKPVTNSRDTQELSFEVGRQMINIFKETHSSTSFLQGMVSSK
ncbi:YTH domain family protein 3 [Wickerhamomyces ciferrii]|uniref:YTH domain family protein 3 n=1 Tax=Wickerhamomyces ciferrii (strain ATCC 14091 / BCRC 22168 / CBS 111 / JCM 3599 / NBRC 0793 / NRRL Y-1031 F-60-10) TaxID=1206466 RepID=K0KIR7_WICCF|nr:YTH domain family protein 3 [Wickerhamomyces ciferrii]CCH41284.1 YTH domain family protein 3 [Wickerhamomyces ciferrii]